MKQWQYDPIQGMNVYNMKSLVVGTKPQKNSPRQVVKTLNKTYRQVITTIKPKRSAHGDGHLSHKDAEELLRRFK